MTAVIVAAGGFIGAVARAAVNHWFRSKNKTGFPYSTFIINLSGSFLLGMCIGLNLQGLYLSFLGTGFMGAFTTFSTFKLENVKMVRDKKHHLALRYILLTCILGVALAFAGYFAGRWIA